MKRKTMHPISVSFLIMVVLATWLFIPKVARAHCDSMDGPVVIEAQKALEKEDVTPVLKWVSKEYEDEIKTAFNKTLEVRKKGVLAQELADNYFFETLVRIHRAGEGAPYTGLKPAGHIDPPVAAADKAIESENVEKLAENIGRKAESEIKESFKYLMDTKKHKDESVIAGREYVEAYVLFVHYIEALHNTIHNGGNHGHGEEQQKKEHAH